MSQLTPPSSLKFFLLWGPVIPRFLSFPPVTLLLSPTLFLIALLMLDTPGSNLWISSVLSPSFPFALQQPWLVSISGTLHVAIPSAWNAFPSDPHIMNAALIRSQLQHHIRRQTLYDHTSLNQLLNPVPSSPYTVCFPHVNKRPLLEIISLFARGYFCLPLDRRTAIWPVLFTAVSLTYTHIFFILCSQ